MIGIRRFLFSSVGLAGGFASIWGLLHIYLVRTGSEGKWGMSLLALFALVSFSLAVAQEYRYSRKARYAEAAEFFREAIHICQSSELTTVNELTTSASKVCDNLSAAFGMITGTSCAVCIKVIGATGATEPQLAVSTLVRDSKSKKRKTDGATHWLRANTAFAWVLSDRDRAKTRFFFDNDLPTRRSYQNTSFEIYDKPPEIRFPFFTNKLRRLHWPLPYRSAIVAPIKRSEEADAKDLLGFLCLDSASKGVFVERYDPEWIVSLAFAVYPIVEKWSNFNRTTGATPPSS